jgi:hypothetical protein
MSPVVECLHGRGHSQGIKRFLSFIVGFRISYTCLNGPGHKGRGSLEREESRDQCRKLVYLFIILSSIACSIQRRHSWESRFSLRSPTMMPKQAEKYVHASQGINMKISVDYYHLVSTRQRLDGFMTYLVPLNNHTNLMIPLIPSGLSLWSCLVASLFCPPPHFLPLSLPLRPIFCLRSSDNSMAAHAQCPHVFNSTLSPAFPYWDLVIRMPQVAFCGRGAGQPARSPQTVMYMLCDR